MNTTAKNTKNTTATKTTKNVSKKEGTTMTKKNIETKKTVAPKKAEKPAEKKAEPKIKKAPAVTPEMLNDWASAEGFTVYTKTGAPKNMRIALEGMTAHVNLTGKGVTVYCNSKAAAPAKALIKDARAQHSTDRDIAFALSADDLKKFLPLYAAGIKQVKAEKAQAKAEKEAARKAAAEKAKAEKKAEAEAKAAAK